MDQELPRLIRFQAVSDLRGGLVAIEGNSEIPFEIKRVFYIYDLKKSHSRGHHAHKQLEEVLIVTSGSATIKYRHLRKQDEVVLDAPNLGLYIPPYTWVEIIANEKNSVCLILCSDKYDEGDYIRNFSKFEIFLREKQEA